MALLTMTTGNIWALEKAYAVLCNVETGENGKQAYSMHFLYTSENITTGDTGGTVTITEGNNSKNLTYTKAYGIKLSSSGDTPPDWNSATNEEKQLITQVVFEESFNKAKVKTCYMWFQGFKNLVAIKGIKNLDTSEVTSMSYMFSGCTSLTSLDLSKFNTTNVNYMLSMFYNCSSLTSLDLSKFNTGKVTTMANMFNNCSSLTSLDLSKFNTTNVTTMANMFEGCQGLTSITFGDNFNTEKVTKMTSMFYGCSKLTSLDLSKFNTTNVDYMLSMFYNCSSLTSLDLNNFNTEKVTTMANMFYGCSSLTSLTFGDKFNTSSVTNMNNMFNGCSSLRLLDLSKATSLNFSNMIGSISNRPLTYVPTGTAGTSGRENVVVDNGCEHLMINYGTTPNNQLLLSAPYGFTAQKITINRKFTKDKPYTLCLPFAVTNTTTYGTFYQYSDYNDGKVKFTKVETTKANKPYLFVPSATLGGSIVIDGETAVGVQTAETSTDREFIGVYRKTTFTGEKAKEGACYGWTDNSDGKGEFRRAGNGASVDACRAYIKLSAASDAPARLSIELDGGATAISTLSTAGSGADGGTDAPVYNLQGQRVSGSYKGVVIKNGKKMIVK